MFIINQIKVTYAFTDADGKIYKSKAYVNENTLIGVDKWTDEPVKLFWSDTLDTYYLLKG